MALEVTAGYRLSPQQRRLWSIQQQGTCVAQCAISLKGTLELQKLKAAMTDIVSRHEILRTTFPRLPGMKQALQVVADEATPEWKIYDLNDAAPASALSSMAEMWAAAKCAVFDLESGPLVRCSLVALSRTEHVLIITLPSLCADRRTLQNLFYELTQSYAGLSEEAAGGETVRYLQYSEWQNELLEEHDGKAAEAYWLNQHFSETSPPRLPGENTSPRREVLAPQSLVLRLEAVVAKLRTTARNHKVSETAILLACWQILLWRLTGEPDILLSLHCHGRVYKEMDHAFGLYSRWPPVMDHLQADLQAFQVFAAADQSIQNAYEWQEYFSAESNLSDSRKPDRAPLQIGFSYEDCTVPLKGGDLHFSLDNIHSYTEPLKLWLAAMPAEDGALRLEFGYDPGVYSVAGIQRLREEFSALLEHALSNPEARLAALQVLGELERRQILSDWNETDKAYPMDQCFNRLFELQVELTPDATAVVFNDESLSYRELNRRANQLAAHLRKHGVGPESMVGLYLDRSVEMVIGLLGILKAGGAFVPMDPGVPAQRLALLLKDAETSVVVTRQNLMPALPGLQRLKILCLDSEREALAQEDESNPAVAVSPDNAAYVIYTSGSTGSPKGVIVQHGSVVNLLRALDTAVYSNHGAALRVSMNASLAFDASIKQVIQLLRGHALYIIPEEVRRDGSELLDYISQHALDVLDCTPSQLRMLFAARTAKQSPLGLSAVLVGGEALDEELWKEMTKSSDTAFYNVYGPTECTVDATACRVQSSLESPTIGRPLANVKIYLLDESGQPVPIGVAGEMHIGGAGLARCYLNQADLTAKQFVPDPFSGKRGARLYKTGDRARYRPDGNLDFLERLDFQVKLRGVRVELGEIESMLNQHPSVGEAIVVVREDEPDQKRLVAYVVPKRKSFPNEDERDLPGTPEMSIVELRSYLKENLPEYMLPSAFVAMEKFPLGANGKVLRRSLPLPGYQRPELDAAFVTPRSEAEITLADIWQRVLKVHRVGLNDNFFELGGDSILSIQVTALAAQRNLRISPRLLFQHQNISALARAATTIAVTAVDQSEVRGSAPLVPIQRRFFRALGSDPHHYNQAVLLALPEWSDAGLHQRALNYLLRYHDALRMRFERGEDGSWRQYNAGVEEAGPHQIEQHDLTELSSGDQTKAMAEITEQLQSGLDLTRGPLLRIAHFTLGQGRGARLLVVIHHLVTDGVSWRILFQDWQALYRGWADGSEVELAAKTSSYKQWGELQEARVRAGELEEEIEYWAAVGAGGAARTVPVNNPGGANTEGAAETLVRNLDEEESRELLGPVCRALRAKPQEVVLAAVGRAVSRWAGADRTVVCVEGHGRESEAVAGADVMRTVGWFTSLYPVEVGGGESVVELVRQAKDMLRATPSHGLGYGMLRELSDEASTRQRLDQAGKADVLFNYLGQVNEELEGDWHLAQEDMGEGTSRRRERAWEVEVVGKVREGRMEIGWRYSRERVEKEEMERVAAAAMRVLKDLISWWKQGADETSVSPSDFPLAGLDQTKLGKVISQIQKAEK